VTHPTIRLAAAAAIAAPACAALLAPSAAQATAFQLRGGSATAIGAALAGRTANDADVSLSIQNPAALRGVQGFEISGGLTGIFPSSDATATITNPMTGTPISATENPNEDAIVPSFAAGWRVNEQVVLGLAVKVPFGLGTEYSNGFPTAVDGTKSELTTLSVTPQASFDFSPRLSIAGGLTIQYADAELANFFPGMGPLPPSRFDVTGDGLKLGFTVGAIFEPIDGTTIGVNYQSKIEHQLQGGFSSFYPPFPGSATFNSGANGNAEFTLPDIASVGVIQRVTDDFRLMAEFEWTGWSEFDSIVINNTDTGEALNDVQDYDDSFMISVGGEYDWSDRLTLRAGAAYDQTPTTDAFRSQRTPDSDRYWLAGGASYEITDRIGLDAAYLLILGDDTTIEDRESAFAADPNYKVDLEDGIVHYFAVNLRYAF
jgi:long-chain fatty acid transport protein